jgi:hypothetical protein
VVLLLQAGELGVLVYLLLLHVHQHQLADGAADGVQAGIGGLVVAHSHISVAAEPAEGEAKQSTYSAMKNPNRTAGG